MGNSGGGWSSAKLCAPWTSSCVSRLKSQAASRLQLQSFPYVSLASIVLPGFWTNDTSKAEENKEGNILRLENAAVPNSDLNRMTATEREGDPYDVSL